MIKFIIAILLIPLETLTYLSSTKIYMDHIETNTKEIVVTQFVNYSYNQQYTILFNFQFNNIPRLIVAIKNVQNCLDVFAQFIHVYQNPVAYLQKYVINSDLNMQLGYDTNMKILLNYLAYDQVLMPYILTNILQTYASQKNYTGTVTFSSGKLLRATTIKSCFLLQVKCRQSFSTFVFKNSCSASSDTTMMFRTQSTGVKPSVCSGFDVKYVFVAIYNDQNILTLTQGVLYSNNLSTSTSLLVNASHPRSFFLIGLMGLESATGCVNVGLKQNNIEIMKTSSFNWVEFNYIYGVFPNVQSAILGVNIVVVPFLNACTFQFILNSSMGVVGNPKFNSSFVLNSFVSNIYFLSIVSSVNDSVHISINTKGGLFYYNTSVSTKIVLMSQINVYERQMLCEIELTNLEKSVQISSFTTNSTEVTVINKIDDSYIQLHYSSEALKQHFTLQFSDSINNIKVSNVLIFPKISKVLTSVASPLIRVFISNLPKIQTASIHSFTSNNTSLVSINPNNLEVEIVLACSLIIQSQSINISYFPDIISNKLQISLELKVITIKFIQMKYGNPGQLRMGIINAHGDINPSQLSFNSSLISVTDIEIINTSLTILTLSYDPSISQTDIFQLKYSPPSQFHTSYTSFNIKQRLLNVQLKDFQIIYTLNNLESLLTPFSLVFSQQSIKINSIIKSSQHFRIHTSQSPYTNFQNLFLAYKTQNSTIYYQSVEIYLSHQLCPSQSRHFYQHFEKVCTGIVMLYWIVFLFGCVTCQKIYAVETLFVLQFSYLSYFQNNLVCFPMRSVSVFKYSFGLIGIPFQLESTNRNLFYQTFGLNSQFLLNINVLLVFVLLCPIIYCIMTYLGKRSKGYRAKPRLLIYGKTFLLDIPLCIILANTCNIVVASIITIQQFQSSNLLSLLLSSLCVILIIAQTIIFILFRNQFRQFHSQFSQRIEICKASIEKSTTIRRMYPVLMFLQIILLSIVLPTQWFIQTKIALYMALGILVTITVFVMIISPYDSTISNIRLFIMRFIMISVCFLQIGHNILQQKEPSSSILYYYSWAVPGLLILLSILTLIYFIYNTVKWCKKQGLIDVNMYNGERALKTRPVKNFSSGTPELCYPALQYSIYANREQKRMIMKQFIQKQKMKRTKVQANIDQKSFLICNNDISLRDIK